MSECTNKVNNFYSEYHGHKLEHLEILYSHLRGTGGGLIWLAGDSSLDNKFWLSENHLEPAIAGYEEVLDPPRSLCDVAHCLNKEAISRRVPLTAINCAVEESRIASRACGTLLAQDRFLRDHIRSNDVLVVSAGGNDIALQPTLCTIVNMLTLIFCTSTSCIEHCSCGCACPCDDCCAGCGPGCLSGCLACPPGLGYFINLFCQRLEAYIRQLISGHEMPQKVLVCMIYYPSKIPEDGSASWADFTLGALGYNTNPAKLQALIRQVFRLATQRISISGTEVVAVPLYEALDPNNTAEYVQRVEPSATGSAKMARLILDAVIGGPQGPEVPPLAQCTTRA